MTQQDEEGRAARLARAIAQKRAASGRGGPALPLRPAGAPALLAPLQEGLWLAHQLAPDSAAYNLASAFRVRGDLDLARLERAFDGACARHRILRSTFRPVGASAEQVVQPHAPRRLETVAARDADPLEAATRAAREPFDLARGPLARLVVASAEGAPERIVVLVLHHLLADERSLAALWDELAAAYSQDGDAAAAAKPEPAQYDDYVHWLAQPGRQERAGDLAFWRARLDPLPDELELPFERALATGEHGAPAGRLWLRPPSESASRGVRALASAAGTTPFVVCAFAFRLLLQRYVADANVAFATPATLRSHPATARMLGYFLGTVVVPTAIDEDQPVAEALRSFAAEWRELFAHAALPFDVLAGELSPPRTRGRHPLFQSMFVYQEPAPAPRFPGAQFEACLLDLGESKFDLTLFVTHGERALEVAVEYRADRFDAVWLAQFSEHYEGLLARLPEDPARPAADVPLVDEAEARRLDAFATGAPLDAPTTPLPRQILERARHAPESPAIVCGPERWSYAELRRAGLAIAAALVAAGVRPGDRVGLFLSRSPHLVAAVCGAHWAGAAYVPLDPGYPAARNADVLADAQVAAVLTTANLEDALPGGAWTTLRVDALKGSAESPPPELPPAKAALADPAYLLYTSGSTGAPKGVVVSHDNLRASTGARPAVYGAPPGRFLLLSSIAFDSSVAGFFWTLATGGTLILPTDEEAKDPARLAPLIAREGVTSLLCVPSLYAYLLREQRAQLASLEIAIVAGEACPSPLVAEHFEALSGARLFNEYGPTEATVWCSAHEMTRADAERPVAIGRPIPGVRLDVLDARGRAVPAGVPGEAWVGGPTVAGGYWNQPERTAERFLAAPLSGGANGHANGGGGGAPCYRTGDRVRWTLDGRLLFDGRVDEQLKLRGFRIEPGEIEAALLADPGVREAAVVAHGADASRAQLVAFLEVDVPDPGGVRRAALAERLPEHLLPSRIVELDALPRLPNGKVDRARLRALELAPEAMRADERVPTEREQTLVALWQGMLGRQRVGLRDNLFELGGHSLLVVELVGVIAREFGVVLSPADVFQNPTVEELARCIEAQRAPDAPHYAHLFPIQPRGDAPALVFCIPHFFSAMLAERFRGERPVYGMRGVSLRAEGNLGRWRTMTDLARELVQEIEQRLGDAPIVLAGYSFGVSMAFEVARLLEERGRPALQLLLITPMALDAYRLGPLQLPLEDLRRPVEELSVGQALAIYARQNHPLQRRPYQRAWQLLAVHGWRRALRLVARARLAAGLPLTPALLHADVRLDRFAMHRRFRPGVVTTPTVFFNAEEPGTDAAATWRPHFAGPLTVVPIPDPHLGDEAVRAAEVCILEHLGDLPAGPGSRLSPHAPA